MPATALRLLPVQMVISPSLGVGKQLMPATALRHWCEPPCSEPWPLRRKTANAGNGIKTGSGWVGAAGFLV